MQLATRWIIFICALNLMGCSHYVRFHTEPEGGYLTIDGRSLGKVSEEGLTARFRPGYGPVPYRLVYVDGFERTGILERSDPDWLLTSAALMGPLVCAPMLCGTGICMVNPGWALAMLAGGVTSVGACQGLMTVASPWTIPAGMFLGSLGFVPSTILLKAEKLPKEVYLEKITSPKGMPKEVMPF